MPSLLHDRLPRQPVNFTTMPSPAAVAGAVFRCGSQLYYSNGTVNMPLGNVPFVFFQASFGAGGSSPSFNINNSTAFTTVALPDVLVNEGGGTWASNLYTIPIPGTYAISGNLRVTDRGYLDTALNRYEGLNVGLGIGVDGVGDNASFVWDSTYGLRKTFSYPQVDRYFFGGDPVRLYTYVDNSNDQNFWGAFLSIRLVRELERTKYRYYRFRPTGTSGNEGVVGVEELAFFETVGGPSLIQGLSYINGGTVYSGGGDALTDNVFNSSSYWIAVVNDGYATFDLGSPKMLRGVWIAPRFPGSEDRKVTSFIIEGSNDGFNTAGTVVMVQNNIPTYIWGNNSTPITNRFLRAS